MVVNLPGFIQMFFFYSYSCPPAFSSDTASMIISYVNSDTVSIYFSSFPTGRAQIFAGRVHFPLFSDHDATVKIDKRLFDVPMKFTFIETGGWNCSCPVHNYIHRVPMDEKKKSDNSVLMSIIHV